MPRCGPNWLSQVWHWPGQLGWGQSVAIPSCCMHVCDAEEDVIGDKLCCKHECGDLPWTTVEIDKNGKRIYRDDRRNRNNPDGVT